MLKRNIKFLIRSLSVLIVILFCFADITFSQTTILQRTNPFNEQEEVYDRDSLEHTVWKPIIYKDSLYVKSNRSWLHRKFFEEHLLQVQEPGFNIFADIVVDEYIGKSKRFVQTPMMNTRGYEVSGNISDKFYFETALYENQGRFPGYVDSFITQNRIVPYQNNIKGNGNGKGVDFSYSTARLVYMPSSKFLFELGYNTNFIGDGYRSLFLADYTTNYPYFRASVNFGKFQYTVMYSQYITEQEAFTYALGKPRKWGQTYLLDWKPTPWLSAGIFNSVVSSVETLDHKKDFRVSLASPIMFLHESSAPSGTENNDIAGLNLKLKIAPKVNVYSQLMIDQFGKNEWEKRYGVQAGVRAGDVLNVKNWNVLVELNTVRPYAYASDTITTAYAHNRFPLAHPKGANFQEVMVVSDFAYKRWWIRAEAFATRYGGDSTSQANFGANIFKSTDLRSKEDQIKTTQGLYTKLYYGDVRLAYILNRKSNLRIESGMVYRTESNKKKNYNDIYIYIGVRTTFRKLIYDF